MRKPRPRPGIRGTPHRSNRLRGKAVVGVRGRRAGHALRATALAKGRAGWQPARFGRWRRVSHRARRRLRGVRREVYLRRDTRRERREFRRPKAIRPAGVTAVGENGCCTNWASPSRLETRGLATGSPTLRSRARQRRARPRLWFGTLRRPSGERVAAVVLRDRFARQDVLTRPGVPNLLPRARPGSASALH